MLVFLGLVLFIVLVVVHEFGHMIVAKRSGVEVEEFGIGFPPRAKLLGKKNGTQYTLNWLPLGGFVKLKGEHDAATEKGSFGAASFSKKALIIAAGVIMNWFAAIVIFTIVALIGMPQLVENQFKVTRDAKVIQQDIFAGSIEEKSPASSIGLQQNDKILTINDTKITSAEQLRSTTKKFGGTKVSITYSHEGQQITKQTTLRNDPKKGNFGVAPGEQTLVRSTWSAPIVGLGTTAQFTFETFRGLGSALGNVFTGHASEAGQSVTGPVGIVVVLQNLARQGLVFVLFLIGVISVSLAVMNVLPIPALDGGRLFVMSLYKVLKKPLKKETEERIHGTGMIVLLALAAVITVVDIRRFF